MIKFILLAFFAAIALSVVATVFFRTGELVGRLRERLRAFAYRGKATPK